MNSKFCAKLQKSLEESVANGDEVRIAFSNPLFSADGENAEKMVLRTGNVFDGNESFLKRVSVDGTDRMASDV